MKQRMEDHIIQSSALFHEAADRMNIDKQRVKRIKNTTKEITNRIKEHPKDEITSVTAEISEETSRRCERLEQRLQHIEENDIPHSQADKTVELDRRLDAMKVALEQLQQRETEITTTLNHKVQEVPDRPKPNLELFLGVLATRPINDRETKQTMEELKTE